MSNRYWRKRIAEEMEQAQKRDMNRQREMQRLYDEALEELQLTIDGLFQRYANKEGLNLAQAKKRASAMDLNIFNRRVKRWVEERDFSPEANKHLKLYNLKGKVSRLELMKQHMKLATAQLAGREEAYVRESLHDEAVRQREIQSGIFGLYAPDSDQFRQQANAIINTPFQGGNWSERIWERQDQLANFLNSAVQRIIMQGKHSTTFQSEVRKKFNSTAYEAKRLLVTETARVQTEVQRQTMEDNGFSQYEYMAEPTACHVCKPLDGQIFKVSDMEPGTNAAPMHPNCKCSSAPYESREDLEDMFDAIAEGRGDEFFAEQSNKDYPKESDFKKFKRTQKLPNQVPKEMDATFYRQKLKEYRKLTRNKFKRGTAIGQWLFTTFASHDSIATLSETERTRYANSKVYLNMLKDLTDERGAGVGYFHEFGHAVDDKMRWKFTRSNKLKDNLEKDFRNMLTSGIPQIIYKQAESSAVSDLISGLSGGAFIGNYHHDQIYWRSEGSLQSEFFAHFFEAQFDKKRRNLLEKHFPISYNYIIKELKEVGYSGSVR